MTEITVDPMTNYQISWTKKKKKSRYHHLLLND